MKKLWWSEGGVIFLCAMDEIQLLPFEVLPHWLKVSLPILGLLAIVVKQKMKKK